ncbi:hypothetical protein [Melghirimyces algeriensis]|uniref:hypothetical protein n=1 Tax=Melghirimyces algeriensis TaxID=910412 RepID=UPI001159E8F4|nr:hypothetical protein [Melghirimyces algeriensis]
MSTWRGLLKKDFQLALPWVLGGFALILMADLWAVWMTSKASGRFGLSLMPILAHILYLPIYLMISLWLEGKQMHQWLHNPHGMWKLLLSKLVLGIPLMLLSLIISGIYPVYLLVSLDLDINLLEKQLNLVTIGQFLLSTVWFSLDLALWGLILWSIFHWLRPFFGKWSWVVLSVVGLAFLYLSAQWALSPTYETLTQWGAIVTLPDNLTMYMGELLHDLLLGTSFFFLSVWILERKLEV